ncbi:hypothetical protein V1512DRAFT_256722 [Lipomyces arxii]|uniref:uncharacterized protein n=1 Tax=Lipomyces arxii TaxID=56418 RepID=UPI0034CE30D9
MTIVETFTRILSLAGSVMTRDAKDWIPVSSQGKWSARFRADSTVITSSSSENISTSSLPRYNSRSSTPYDLYDGDDSDELDSKSHSRRSAYSRARSDIMLARRQITLNQKLMAGLIGVWLVILVVLLFRSNGPQADFDPLRDQIHRSKKIIAPTESELHYVGRWSRNRAKGSATGLITSTYFPGTYVDIRFTGTSLGIHLGNLDDPVLMTVRIDNSRRYDTVPYGREVVSVAKDLPASEHEARLIFSKARRTDIEAFYVDRGSRLLPYVNKQHPRRPIIEVVQDNYNSTHPDALTWSYLLSDYYDVDRVFINAEDMCISNCPNDQMSVDKYYFLGSLSAAHSMPKYWHFEEYRPKLIIFDLGLATKKLMDKKLMYKTLLPQDASKYFSEAYMNLLRTLRKKAHRRVPIFVLRPFDGSLEVESLEVVHALRSQGDKNIHWIDTTAWTSKTDDERTKHEKRAAYLSRHACPFLRPQSECEFLYPFEGRRVGEQE